MFAHPLTAFLAYQEDSSSPVRKQQQANYILTSVSHVVFCFCTCSVALKKSWRCRIRYLKGAAAPPAAGPFNSTLHTGDPILGLNVFLLYFITYALRWWHMVSSCVVVNLFLALRALCLASWEARFYSVFERMVWFVFLLIRLSLLGLVDVAGIGWLCWDGLNLSLFGEYFEDFQAHFDGFLVVSES